jgi:hypothetical protein
VFRTLLLAAALAAALVIPAAATAQNDATPAAGTPVAGEVLDPALCPVEPRPAAELLALATPAASPATPAATLAAPEIPFGAFAGTPADAETAAAYTAFIRQFWTCNGYPGLSRLLALLTDEEVRQAFAPEDLVSIAQAPEGTPEPGATLEPITLFAVLDAEDLPDGRVGAYSVVDTPFDPLTVEVNYLIAVETADGWRLDEFVCFNEVGGYCA